MSARTVVIPLLLAGGAVLGQPGGVRGVVTDVITGETLIGATVTYAEGKGTVTDIDGRYTLALDPGEYSIAVSFVGFEPFSRKVVVQDVMITLDAQMRTKTLAEVEIVADVAIDRETPVAFSNISPEQIQEELASRDIPLLLNSTPGVYATSDGGGDGDARITIRGFSQENVAVLLDGVPVNDMENGAVYWSNWFGLDVVTKTVQVQRGLGASKIAIPSVGGTMNIITAGIDQKRRLTFKQEVGNNNFVRSTLGYSTGQLKGGWGFTFAGSFKRGDGWVDQTWTKGYFYYAKVEKKLGKHLVSLSGFGAPQEHGQRIFRERISTYCSWCADKWGSSSYDQSLGLGVREDFGRRYNSHAGELERFDFDAEGNRSNIKKENLNARKNFYHKPQFSLRDLWAASDRLYISNVAYLSIGNGGGTRLTESNPPRVEGTGQVDFQDIYNRNSGYGYVAGLPDFSFSENPEKQSKDGFIRSLNNNHFWYGLLSTATYKLNDRMDLSGGIDLRSYEGEHYSEVYDLLGGEFTRLADDKNENVASDSAVVGDKMSYYNDALVKWGGAFLQLERKTPAFSWFLSGSFASTGYRRIDYFAERDVVIGGRVYHQAVGYGDTFYVNGSDFITAYQGATVTVSGDTTFVENGDPRLPDGFVVNAESYEHDDPEARTSETEWKWIPGFTVKGGANYNLNEWHNVFINLGHLNKAPRFDRVYDFTNKPFTSIKNEEVYALELGWSYKRRSIALNVNGYYTMWRNKPVNTRTTFTFDEQPRTVNINGMDAVHAGVELDAAWKMTDKWTLEGLISFGDWTWQSKVDSLVVRDEDGNPAMDDDGIAYVNFDARGVHVGDAAQTQIGAMLKCEPTKRSFIKVRGTYFDRHYADFNPFTLNNDEGNNFARRESWRMPSYMLFEMHAGYRWEFKKFNLKLNGSVLNALDAYYVADATNNDSFATPALTGFDATSATVFFGQGRRWNVSLAIEL